MITTAGKTTIKRFLAGQVSRFGGSLALGVGTTAAVLGDIALNYEVVRLPVASMNVDLDTDKIIFRADLPPGTLNTIYEIGLYSEDQILSSNVPLDLAGLATWTNATLVTTNARVSPLTAKVDFVANGTTNAELIGFSQDWSGFVGTDQVAVAFQATSNLSTLRVRVGTDSANYYEFLFSSPIVGYNIKRVPLSSATVTGSPDLSNLVYLAVRPSATAGGSGSVFVDSIQLEANPLSSTNLLVARTVLGTPYVTDPNISNDVEYSLGVSFV